MELVAWILGSGAIAAIVSGVFQLINRWLDNKGEKSKILERDILRTQLLLMIADFPTEKSDIMKLAQHYFEDLDGNWVLSSVFTDWMKDNDIDIPEWFNHN